MASWLLRFVSTDYHDLWFIFYGLMSRYQGLNKNQCMYLLGYARYWLVLVWFGKFYLYSINLIPEHLAGEVACNAIFLLMVTVPTNLVLSGTCCTTWCTDGQLIGSLAGSYGRRPLDIMPLFTTTHLALLLGQLITGYLADIY